MYKLLLVTLLIASIACGGINVTDVELNTFTYNGNVSKMNDTTK